MADLERIIEAMPQRFAVAELIGYCQGLLKTGALGSPAEDSLRQIVNRTCVAFGMPSITDKALGGHPTS